MLDLEQIAEKHRIVGRRTELTAMIACFIAGRNVLLEGAVGVGKTALARAAADGTGRGIVRVDGDSRYTESRLVGHFDPPGVLEKGYQPELFIPGPLASAMLSGSVLFINELNRMPEGVQNVLLPALDEGIVQVPHLGEIRAADGFTVVATQNPGEFVATGHLSEALLDRFELVVLGYQDEAEETIIVTQEARCAPSAEIIAAAVAMARATRTDKRIRRGASVRAAIAIADLTVALGGDLSAAARLALPTRIELGDETKPDAMEKLLKELEADLEKKTLQNLTPRLQSPSTSAT
ncbi:MAG: MoxR-like ATPase [Myxococcota bacterium]|jgi:MoxR-like ATPase